MNEVRMIDLYLREKNSTVTLYTRLCVKGNEWRPSGWTAWKTWSHDKKKKKDEFKQPTDRFDLYLELNTNEDGIKPMNSHFTSTQNLSHK